MCRRRRLERRFQFSIGDALSSLQRPRSAVICAFQFSIGDAPWCRRTSRSTRLSGFNSLLEMLDHVGETLLHVGLVRFNSLLEMQWITDGEGNAMPTEVSILYWRCRASDGHTGAGGYRDRVSILYWRCRLHKALYALIWDMAQFQFSIGDARTTGATPWSTQPSQSFNSLLEMPLARPLGSSGG